MDSSNCQNLKDQIYLPTLIINNSKYYSAQQVIDAKSKLLKIQNEIEANDGCVVDLVNEKCAQLETRITSLINMINTQSTLALTDNRIYATVDSLKKQLTQLKADYELNGCLIRVEQIKQDTVKEIATTYQELSKERIDTLSIYERNKRVFFGGIVILLALVLVSTNKNE